MSKRIALATFVCAVLLLVGCQGKLEKIDKTCAEFQKISTIIDDCPKMGKKLASTVDDFADSIDSLRDSKDSDGERRKYIKAMSVCTRTLLDISTGPCRDDESVRAALSKMQK